MVEDAELVCKRAEGEVAGFGDAQRRLDRFQVAHFADQHHVRVFTKRGAQGVGKALGVGVQFALVDHAVLVHVHEFDRVLDGEDVSWRSVLILSIMAASVVDLPEPVGPVTSTSPRGLSHSLLTTGGRPN